MRWTQSAAGYGQVDWKVTDTIKLTGGIRYTSDKKYGVEDYRIGIAFGALANFNTPSRPWSCRSILVWAEDAQRQYLPAFDITSRNIATDKYPGVTCLPTLLPNGMEPAPSAAPRTP